MSCKDRKDLFLRYGDATREYSTLVRELTSKTAVIGLDEYEELRASTENARLRSERTRSEYERHVLEHSCQGTPEEARLLGHAAA
jgi:hypothetical protein